MLLRILPSFLTLVVVLGLSSISAVARAQSVAEYDIKAAYIYNFAMFTEWPASSLAEGASFNICVRKNHPMRNALGDLSSKTIKGRRVALKPWHAEGLRDCHILLLDESDRDQWKTTKASQGTVGVLSVTDVDAAAPDAVITLALAAGMLAFSVDTGAARQAQLVLSAKLLRLAKTVQ